MFLVLKPCCGSSGLLAELQRIWVQLQCSGV